VAAIVQCKRGRFGVLTRHRGKEKWQTIGAGEEGRSQAQELAAEINRQLEEERAREESEFLDWHSPGAALPIDRALRDWLFHYGPTVGRSTLDRYRSLVDHQLVPYFGGKDLGALRDTDVIGFASSQYRAGAARDPVLNALSCLRRVIHLALEKGHLARHPLPRMLRIAKQVARAQGRATVRADAWTKEEAAILLDLAREHEPCLFPLLSFAFLTGVRKGEAIGLRWSAVHLEQGTIEILWAISHGEGGPPKWGKNRTIQIPDSLVPLLEELRGRRARRGKSPTGDDWVFLPAGRGRRRKIGEREWPRVRPWSESFLTRVFARVLKRAVPLGVRRLSFHATRHSYATWALSASHDPLEVANNLGHSPEVLWSRYTHLLRGRRRRDFSFLDLPSASEARRGSLRLAP
jgi:integrase